MYINYLSLLYFSKKTMWQITYLFISKGDRDFLKILFQRSPETLKQSEMRKPMYLTRQQTLVIHSRGMGNGDVENSTSLGCAEQLYPLVNQRLSRSLSMNLIFWNNGHTLCRTDLMQADSFIWIFDQQVCFKLSLKVSRGK